MPLTIITSNGTLTSGPSPTQQQRSAPEMPFEIEKTNEIEKPAQPAPPIGDTVAITNPIVVYSDVPGAGPVDYDFNEADAEDEEQNEEDRQAQVREQPKGKAVNGPPNNKAMGKANKK